MLENQRTALLRAEMMRRMGDDWHLDGERGAFDMTLKHAVPLRWWEIFLSVVLSGVFAYPLDYRTAHIWIDEDGVIHSKTTGEYPRGLKNRYRDWEIPDTP